MSAGGRARAAAGALARRAAPRTVENLATLDGLRAEVAALRHEVESLRAQSAELRDGLQESRELQLRAAELTDLVADRLAEGPR